MPQVDKTLLFSSVANANPATPPTGYTQPTGVSFQAQITGGKFSLSSDAYATAFWYDNTVLTGTDIRASVVLDSIAVTAGITAGCGLVDTSGNGWVVLCGGSPANIRVFAFVAWVISGGVLGTDSTVPVLGDSIQLRRVPSSGAMTVWINGVQSAAIGTITSLTYSPNRAVAASRKSTAKLTSLTSTYFEPYGITSVDSDDSIEIGQSGFTIVTEGFTAQPVATTDNASITVTLTGGSSNSWTATVNDRTEAGTSPDLPTTFTLTLTNGSEVAIKVVTITKKSTETLVTFTSPEIVDNKFLGYWMTAAGHTVDGADFWYIPFGDLVVNASSACLTTNAGTFTGWLRPTLGATAGKTYEFTVTVNETGVVVTADSKNHYIGFGLGVGF